MNKTIKQIKRFKGYRLATVTYVWTAKMINGGWVYFWYDLEDFEKNNDEFIHNVTEKLEYYFGYGGEE